MDDSQTIDVEVTPGQYEALMRLTTPDGSQAQHIAQLRNALENAVWRKRLNRFQLPGMTIKTIEGAEFVLQVNAAEGSKATTLYLNRFRRSYKKYLTNTSLTGRFTVAWTFDDCSERKEFASSRTYTASEAEARRRELADGGAYDIEIRPV